MKQKIHFQPKFYNLNCKESHNFSYIEQFQTWREIKPKDQGFDKAVALNV
jgi:hypothetical protein